MEINSPNHQGDPRFWGITFDGAWDEAFFILNSDSVDDAWRNDIDWRDPHGTVGVHDMPERFDRPEYEWLAPNRHKAADLLRFLGWRPDGPVRWPNFATKLHERDTLIGILNLQASLVAKCSPMPLDCVSALWLLTRDCQLLDQITACPYSFDTCWSDRHAEDRIDAMIKQACKVYRSEGAEQYVRRRIYTTSGFQVPAADRLAAPVVLFEWVKRVSYTGRIDKFRQQCPDRDRRVWVTGITREFADSRGPFERKREEDESETPARQAPQPPPPPPPLPPPSTVVPRIQNVADSPNFWNKRRRDGIIAGLRSKGIWKARSPTAGVAPSTTIACSPYLVKTSPRTPVVPHLVDALRLRDFRLSAFPLWRGLTFNDFTNDYYWNAMPLRTAGVMLTNLYNAQGLLARKDTVYYFDFGFGDDGNAHLATCMTNLVNLYKNCGAPDDLLDILRSNSWIVDALQQTDAWSCGLQTAEFIRAYIREGLTTPSFSEKVTQLEALRSRWISWITGEFCDLRFPYNAPHLRRISLSYDDFMSRHHQGDTPPLGLLSRPAEPTEAEMPARPSLTITAGVRPVTTPNSDSPLTDRSHTPGPPPDNGGAESEEGPGTSPLLPPAPSATARSSADPDTPPPCLSQTYGLAQRKSMSTNESTLGPG
ncbi:hypothetical protein QIS74_04988 [Colletotrichum tabaci]|uniref:Ubiquitin-like protease family profile domain-containing protein n=1 Tax=Colletotrichum tabaci TaxID=1209068 RepID=A0AAV9TGQ0_9PEZI